MFPQLRSLLNVPLLLSPLAAGLMLGGCAVGPDFVRADTVAPTDWTQWRGGDASLNADVGTQALRPAWWTQLSDPTLDELQERALQASPDLRTAALHFAQARAQRRTVEAQRGVDVNASAGVNRQRQSENGAGTRMLDILSNDSDALKQLLAEPFNQLHQIGPIADQRVTGQTILQP